MKPNSVNELKVGARVCAFWSNQMNYLHPGTVAGPDSDENFVIIQLDDGDSRDIHVDFIRYLPADYPIVGRSNYLLINSGTSYNPCKGNSSHIFIYHLYMLS